MTNNLKQRFEKFRYGGCNDKTYLEILAFIKDELEALAVEVESYDPKEYAIEAQEGFSTAAAIIRDRIKSSEV